MGENGINSVARLTELERDTLSAYAAKAVWPASFAVYQRGAPADGVFIVLHGRVVLRSRVRAARGFVPAIVTPGETFGSEGLSAHAHYATDARTDVETATLFLSTQTLRAFVREQPQHALALVSQLMAERVGLLERLREVTTLSVEQRLIASLLRLASTQTFALQDGRLELTPPRYRLLCELVGATRESVSLVLGRLIADGLVDRKGGTLIVGHSAPLRARLETMSIEGDAGFGSFANAGAETEQNVQ